MIIEGIWRAKWELLFFQMLGVDNAQPLINKGGPVGYISVLLICSLILYWIIKNHTELFIHVIAPVVIVAGLGRIINVHGNLSQWVQFDGWVNVGLIRGMVDMAVGAWFALTIVPRLDKLSVFFRRILVIGLPIIFISFLVLGRSIITYSDLAIYIFVFGFWISLTFLEKVEFGKFEGIVQSFGRISYVIFLFHFGIAQLMGVVMAKVNMKIGLCIFVLINILWGTGVFLIEEYVFKKKLQKKRIEDGKSPV